MYREKRACDFESVLGRLKKQKCDSDFLSRSHDDLHEIFNF